MRVGIESGGRGVLENMRACSAEAVATLAFDEQRRSDLVRVIGMSLAVLKES